MAQSDSVEIESPAAAFGSSHRLVRRLAWLYGALTLGLLLFLSITLLPLQIPPEVKAAVTEAGVSGFGSLVSSILMLTVTTLLAALLMTTARLRLPAVARVVSVGFRSRRLSVAIPHMDAGFSARIGQSVILPLGAAVLCFASWWFWPTSDGASTSSTSANLLAAIAFGMAFPALVTERAMSAVPVAQLPEALALRRLLLITTIGLGVAGALEILRGVGLAWAMWPMRALAIVPALIAIELALRALARLFLPPPAAASAKAATDSILADVLTRGPRAPAALVKTHLGLDFSRSWALSFLSKAVVPALALTAVFCWLLTGLKLIDTGQRGVYERLGSPVAVLGPGLHVVLPWPIGQVRFTEFGTIHSVAAGTDETGDPDQGVSAEAIPPPSLNRLWSTTHATQAQYLVASESGGKQNFQTVNTEILVLYRTGLTDADAMQAVYGAVDQQTLVRQAASRLAVRYFSSRTLATVMGAERQLLQDELRAEIAVDLAKTRAGIEIVAVVVEEIHPPAEAAAAYHLVQAAGIKAEASISTERGKAATASAAADAEAIALTNGAQATAVEKVQDATGEAYRFAADKRGYQMSPSSFLTERTYSNLAAALSRVPLTIVDHRINTAGASVLDLRAQRPAGKPDAAVDAATTDTQKSTP